VLWCHTLVSHTRPCRTAHVVPTNVVVRHDCPREGVQERLVQKRQRGIRDAGPMASGPATMIPSRVGGIIFSPDAQAQAAKRRTASNLESMARVRGCRPSAPTCGKSFAHPEVRQPVPQDALSVQRQPMRVSHCRRDQLWVHAFIWVGFVDLCQVANPFRVVVCPQPDSHD
jgi:hypothetical protein